MKPYYSRAGIYIFNADCTKVKLPINPSLVLTDPPYGVSNNCSYRKRGLGPLAGANNYAQVYGDSEDFDPTWLLALNTRLVLFGAIHFMEKLPRSDGWIIWDKTGGGRHFSDQADAELAWANFLGRQTRIFHHMWKGMLKDSERTDKRVHPTQKPVALMRWIIKAACPPGCWVLDPYMGAGSTLIAAVELKRPAIGIEIIEEYCKIAADRVDKAITRREVEEINNE